MSQEVLLKRRAVVTGLSPFLKDEALLKAVVFWEESYASAPRFALQRFVAELCRGTELANQRSEVLLSLVEAMGMEESSLLPDPFSGKSRKAPSKKIALGPIAQAFVLLMEELLESVPKDVGYNVRRDLQASLDTKRLPAELVAALQLWLNERAPLQITNADLKMLRLLVNRTYVLLCERMGPVAADKMLSGAVANVVERDASLESLVTQLL